MRTGCRASVATAVFLFCLALCLPGTYAAAPARVKLKPLGWKGLPKIITGVLADSKDELWLEDVTGGRVCVYDPHGKLIRTVGSPGTGYGQLQKPRGMALDETKDLLAVADSDMLMHFFRASTGAHERTIPLFKKGIYTASFGFFLTPERIVFTAVGRSAENDSPPITLFQLFSTDYRGGGLRVELSKRIKNPDADAGIFVLARGFALKYGKNLWAVGRTQPPQVMLVSADGRIVKASKAEGTISPFLVQNAAIPGYMQDYFNSHPHPVGILRNGDRIGLVWRRPVKAGSRLSIQWFSPDLKPAGSTALSIGRLLDPGDSVAGVAQVPGSRVFYLVVLSGDSGGTGAVQAVYRGKLQ